MKLASTRFATFVALMVLFTFCAELPAADWPQWRGLDRDGQSKEIGLLKKWAPGGPPLLRRISGVGTGYAGVAVVSSRIYSIGRHDREVFAFAVSADSGEFLWRQKIGETERNPSSTPVVVSDQVYVLDPDGNLYCLRTSNGQIVWHRKLTVDFHGKMMSSRGYGETPLIDGDRLVCTPGGGDTGMVVLNRHTGDLIWKAPLPDLGPTGSDGAAFSSVMVSDAAGVRQYVQLVGRGLMSLNAADGKFLWGYNAIANTNANIPTPLVFDDFVFSANGYTAGAVLLRISPNPDSTESAVKAEVEYALKGNQFQNHHGGFVRIGDFIYGGHGNNNGLPTCLEVSTGKIRWKRRGPGVGSAAVIAADGRLYFRYQDGLVAMIAATPERYELCGQLQIAGAGGDSWSHPAISDGKLFLREQNTLLIYDVREVSASGSVPIAGEENLDPVISKLKSKGISADSDASVPEKDVSSPDRQDADAVPAGTLTVVISDEQLLPDGTLPAEITDSIQNACRDGGYQLALKMSGTAVSANGLRQITALRPIGLDLELSPQISDDNIDVLSSASELRVLNLSGTAVTENGLRKLSGLSLQVLRLELCDGISDAACAPLSEMKTLRYLSLRKSGFERQRITSEGLKKLSELHDLRVLNLYGNGVDDDGIGMLASLPQLEVVDLSLLPLSDQCASQLARCRSLRELSLLYAEGFAGPKMTSAGVQSLTELTTLERLNLTGARLTDQTLNDLLSLRELKLLEVVRTGLSSDAVARFRVQRSECRLVVDE